LLTRKDVLIEEGEYLLWNILLFNKETIRKASNKIGGPVRYLERGSG